VHYLQSIIARLSFFTLREEWHTSVDLDRQIRSSHYTRLLAIMEEAAEPPELRLNWVTDVKGLEYLEAVRLFDR
jgi:hypothetical protein